MRSNGKYSKELKLELVKRYLRGESPLLLVDEYAMPRSARDKIRHWAHKYELYGEIALESFPINKAYSKELKNQVINEYLSGHGSYENLATKYNITKPEIVRSWVIKYNSGIEIKDYDSKNEVYTMKSRKTTFEERLNIVKYVLTNNNDYKGAENIFSVPYASVYQWVKKYKEFGEAGLSDKRGRPSSAEQVKELTIEEKQAIEIEKLKRELERKDMIIEVLKKNKEIQEQMERNSRLFVKNTHTKR